MGVNLKNQVGIIVGASSGMGAASAVLLAQKGMAVTLAARSGPSLASLEKQIRKTGGEASVCQTDVTQRDNIEQMIQHTQQNTAGSIFSCTQPAPTFQIVPFPICFLKPGT